MMWQAAAPPGPVDSVIGWVGNFILGGIAIFAVYIAYWTIKQWRDSRDAHTEDLKVASEQHVEMHKAYQASNSDVVAAINRLSETQQAHTVAVQANTSELAAIRISSENNRSEIAILGRRIDDVIRDAVRRRSHDRMPAIKGESKS